MKKYSDLNTMLQQDSEAKYYFNALPAYVRDSIGQRPNNVNSLESLRDYAENLLRGDD